MGIYRGVTQRMADQMKWKPRPFGRDIDRFSGLCKALAAYYALKHHLNWIDEIATRIPTREGTQFPAHLPFFMFI